MGIKSTWAPNTEIDIDEYELYKSADNISFSLLITIDHDTGDPLIYDSVNQVFFYVDTTGLTTDWYKVRAKDAAGNYSGFTISKQGDPVTPSLCTLYGTVLNNDGTPDTEAQVLLLIKSTEQSKEGQFVSTNGVTSTQVEVFTDDAGYWEADVLQLATIDINIPRINLRTDIIIPAAPSAELTTLL